MKFYELGTNICVFHWVVINSSTKELCTLQFLKNGQQNVVDFMGNFRRNGLSHASKSILVIKLSIN